MREVIETTDALPTEDVLVEGAGGGNSPAPAKKKTPGKKAGGKKVGGKKVGAKKVGAKKAPVKKKTPRKATRR